MKQQKKQTKILRFYFIIGIFYMSGFVSFITIRCTFCGNIVFPPNVVTMYILNYHGDTESRSF